MNLKRVFLNRAFRFFLLVLIIFTLIYLSVNLGACEPRKRVIKIGNQAVLSGEYRSFGEEQLVSIKLAASKLSPVRIGGFDYEIEVVTKDDEGNPEKAFLVAQEMVDEGVTGVIGSTFAGTTKVSVPVYEEYGIPVISPYAQKTEISSMGNIFFRMVMNNEQKIENIADFIVNKINPQKLMLINNQEEYSIELVDYLREVLSDYGIETAGPMSIKISEEDVAVIAENLLIEGPDTIFFCGSYNELASLMTKAREIGLGSRFITEKLGMDDKIFDLADAQYLEGLIAIIPEPPSLAMYSQDAKAINFWRDFNNYLSQMDDSNISIDGPGDYAPYCYDSVFVIIEAMKRSNSISTKDYIDELKTTSYDGLVGHIEFDSNGDRVNPLSTVFIVKDGAWIRY
ncbi:MAG: branched-chain amino acid ABC transporter substrate-binding protein [Actinobacteria bacterium]|nr:branched-chain amino acid ABC transporter substrate-binding protein [Chloroflexota bacterium]MBE3128598.1 branched-chain amino acid ABC transporter substrate-binding protein [Actinomycetota bacterium]